MFWHSSATRCKMREMGKIYFDYFIAFGARLVYNPTNIYTRNALCVIPKQKNCHPTYVCTYMRTYYTLARFNPQAPTSHTNDSRKGH
jgi:hypothetical protein